MLMNRIYTIILLQISMISAAVVTTSMMLSGYFLEEQMHSLILWQTSPDLTVLSFQECLPAQIIVKSLCYGRIIAQYSQRSIYDSEFLPNNTRADWQRDPD